MRHRAGTATTAHWDVADLDEGRQWPEYVHRLARLCVIIAVGAVLTGIALAVTHRLHPVAAPAPAAAPAPTPTGVHTEPPWTVPLPTVPPSVPAPSVTSTAATTRPKPTTPPTRRRASDPAPVPTTPAAAPVPVLLGPSGDDALEAALTSYCVHIRGELAVAALDNGEWGCRYAERTTALPMNAACRWQHGTEAWAMTLDDANPYSWRCFRD
jgi:hypothetical protein